jgi:thiol-disulfide isomerase/thioredoxin
MRLRHQAIALALTCGALAIGTLAVRHERAVRSAPVVASAAPCGAEAEACGAHSIRDARGAAARPIEGRPRMLVFSSRSCAACKRMEPLLESALEACGADRDVYRVDFDDEAGEGLAATYGVTLLPSFVSVDTSGVEVARLTGLQPEATLKRAIEEVRGARCASADEPKRAKAM